MTRSTLVYVAEERVQWSGATTFAARCKRVTATVSLRAGASQILLDQRAQIGPSRGTSPGTGVGQRGLAAHVLELDATGFVNHLQDEDDR